MRLRSIVVASAAMLAAALAFVMSTPREARVAVRRAARPDVAAVPAIGPAPRREAASGAAAVTPTRDEWSADDLPAKVAERFRQAKDKREFFDRAAKAGGGANLYFALQAAGQCSFVNGLGMVGAEQDWASRVPADDPLYERRMRAYRESIAGCDGFERRQVSRQELSAIAKRMYAAADPMGRAHNLRPYPDDAARYDEERPELRRLLDTRDAYVIGQLVPYLAARAAGNVTWSQVIADDRRLKAIEAEKNAWRWALCDLGEDCTPEGLHGRSSCFGLGLCDWKSIDEIAPTWFSATPAIRARRDEIVAAVRAGDWEKLGL